MFFWIIKRDLLLAIRRQSDVLTTLFFFVIVVLVVVLTITLLWLSVLRATLMPLFFSFFSPLLLLDPTLLTTFLVTQGNLVQWNKVVLVKVDVAVIMYLLLLLLAGARREEL